MYRLKKGVESFEIVDGPQAGLKFERGKTYSQAPEGYRRRFEPADPPAAKDKPEKGAKSK
jgi:hypothetical protein